MTQLIRINWTYQLVSLPGRKRRILFVIFGKIGTNFLLISIAAFFSLSDYN